MTKLKAVKGLSVKDQAKADIAAEVNADLVEKYKIKLKELNAAKKIVKNIQREIDDLEEEIEQDKEDLS